METRAIAAIVLGDVQRCIRAAKNFPQVRRIHVWPVHCDADAPGHYNLMFSGGEWPAPYTVKQIVDSARRQIRSPTREKDQELFSSIASCQVVFPHGVLQ